MKKVVVGVDGSEASRAGVKWCALNLTRTTRVIAVTGMSETGEFVMSLPGPDAAASTDQVRETFRQKWCAPLDAAGLEWEARFVHHSQPTAIAQVVDDEQPDLVVIGKPEHVALDLMVHGKLQHALHHAQCPVLIVPSAGAGAP
ncbi:MAG TPA: universal stress protein [Acidimicrobiales bacterium]|nr:universal stress protein [Acidimicrobiales bacterium]